jgi:uncharacterized membrane protein YkoI
LLFLRDCDKFKEKTGGIFMKKSVIALLLLVVMAFGLLTACADTKMLTEEEAKKVALDAVGLKAEDVGQIDVHASQMTDTVAYSIFFSHDGENYSFIIDGKTGLIVQQGNEAHSHSH